jgi:hypothetical protein
VDLWTTHLFYFSRIPSTDRLLWSEWYRANLQYRSGPFHSIELSHPLIHLNRELESGSSDDFVERRTRLRASAVSTTPLYLPLTIDAIVGTGAEAKRKTCRLAQLAFPIPLIISSLSVSRNFLDQIWPQF